ncbi:hypothetical protein D3C77_776920 [compost metagenome]
MAVVDQGPAFTALQVSPLMVGKGSLLAYPDHAGRVQEGRAYEVHHLLPCLGQKIPGKQVDTAGAHLLLGT